MVLKDGQQSGLIRVPFLSFILWNPKNRLEASHGPGAQSVTAKSTGCEFVPHSRR